MVAVWLDWLLGPKGVKRTFLFIQVGAHPSDLQGLK